MENKYKSMLKILYRMPYELSEAERKTQIVLFIPLGLIICFIFSGVLGILMGSDFILFFPAFCLLIPGIVLVIYFWDKLDKKYGMRQVRSPLVISYQGLVIFLLSWAPTFFFLMLTLGVMSDDIFFGLGAGIAVVYPIVGMFLRIKTFSDESIPNEGGGYIPISYWIIAMALGIFTIGSGFSSISSYISKGIPSLEFIIVSIVIGLLLQTVYLFPDKLNKIVPIDLRTKKGFLFMFVLAFVLFGISQLLIDSVMVLIS